MSGSRGDRSIADIVVDPLRDWRRFAPADVSVLGESFDPPSRTAENLHERGFLTRPHLQLNQVQLSFTRIFRGSAASMDNIFMRYL
jgi:hypothetical protein